MYKLILVDDESDVREGILQEIQWEVYGFEVIGTAENGREAYDLIDRTVPDTVITDIKMPFMDGLSLAELIKQKYPATKIIILTGFDEFEFAQKALKLHIDEYVLKPFSSRDLLEVLVRIKSQMDDEVAQKNDLQMLKAHYTSSLPILKANFLTLLITRKLKDHEILEKSKNIELNLAAKGYMVSVVSMDGLTDENTDYSLFAVLNITEEIVGKYAAGIVFMHNGNVVVLSLDRVGDCETFLTNTQTLLEEIRYYAEKFLKLTVTIGAGTFCCDLSGISYSFKGASSALDYRLILGSNRIIFINDLEARNQKEAVFDELMEDALICSLKMGTVEKVTQIIEALFQRLKDSCVSYGGFQICLTEILMSIFKLARNARLELNEIMDSDVNPLNRICQFSNIGEAKNWTLEICSRIMNNIAMNRQDYHRQLSLDAEAFTRNHFQENDMSINKVCKHLHISPGYFSTIFKKEMKMTYLSYLVKLRMEAAREFLKMTALKSFEIAERVGFSDANYFSNSFKKYYGISPTEFRSRK